MIALDIMLVALAQASAPPAAAEPSPVARPDVEVVGPSVQNRVICRTISVSTSRIPGRRVCRTQAEIEEIRDREQRNAEFTLQATQRLTGAMLETSSVGNWSRSHGARPM